MNQPNSQHKQWPQQSEISQAINTESIIKQLIPWLGASKGIHLSWPCFPLPNDSKTAAIILITSVVNFHKSGACSLGKYNAADMKGEFN